MRSNGNLVGISLKNTRLSSVQYGSFVSIGSNLYDNSSKGKDGLVIITACSHSGICNIIEYSKSLFPNTKIHSIIGGFHLLKVDDKLRKTIDYLKEQDIDIIYSAHCTCLQAKIQMAKYMNIQEVGVNLKLEFK